MKRNINEWKSPFKEMCAAIAAAAATAVTVGSVVYYSL